MSKKVGKSQKEESSYEIRDVVLAKVRGFPPWPGMIVDPENVPSGVSKERPASKKTVFYCIRFFPVGDYAWLVSKDISKLQTHEIEAYISAPFKRSGDLLAGYRIALDPKKWEEEREALGLEVGEEEANAEIDELDSENEGGEDKKATKPKKRKRESGISPSTPKPKPKGKPKKEASDRRKKTPTKSKKNGTTSKAMVESEDEGDARGDDAEDEDAGPSKKSSPPPAKKLKRDKDDEDLDPTLMNDPEAIKVREWRHKLQKTFLSNKGLPKEEDMPALDHLFTTVENYDRINIQYLSFSKIGKVMRHITALPLEKVPRDEEFHFRDRAKALVDKWHQILKPNGEPGTNGAPKSDGGMDHPDAVTVGTAALNINGKSTEGTRNPPVVDGQLADMLQGLEELTADGDVSAIAEVTMSEA